MTEAERIAFDTWEELVAEMQSRRPTFIRVMAASIETALKQREQDVRSEYRDE